MNKLSTTYKETTANLAGAKINVPTGTEVQLIAGAGGGWALTDRAACELLDAQDLSFYKLELKHRYAYLAEQDTVLGYNFNATYNGTVDKWASQVDAWLITINNQTFEYFTGLGLRKGDEPVAPSYDDVMYCLTSDAQALDMCFEDWADAHDYEQDSRKAEALYKQCVDTGLKLRKAGVDMKAEQERLQDY